MQTILLILTALGSSGLFSFLFQESIKTKYQAIIARLESELAQQNFRHSTVFVKTEESISQIYEKLLRVLDILEDHTWLMAAERDAAKNQERLKALNDAFNDFYKYYRPKKIYLRKSTQNQIKELMNTAIELLRAFQMGDMLRSNQPLTPAGQARQEKLDLKFEELHNKISPLLLALEEEFQEVLGFPKDQKSKSRSGK
jgi:hypothetical protein